MSRRNETRADVIVVGAGPAGSTAAYEMARVGARVVLLEEHPAAGTPCHCAGLVSPRTLELAGLPIEGTALASYRRARIWGPLGSQAWLESGRVQAVAIDRTALDQHLLVRAAQAGAHLWPSHRAERLERLGSEVRVTASNHRGTQRVRAPIVIGADGAHSQVARWLDGDEPWDAVPAVRADVVFEGSGTEEIEVFVGREVAPGWFGWMIPLGGGRARLGLGGRCRDLKRRYGEFLQLLERRFGAFHVEAALGWAIAAIPRRRIAFDHGMLIGDAARQAKPSSGGGVYMGMRAGLLAARTALHALARGDPGYNTLAAYEHDWMQQEGDELRYNHWLRSIFNTLSDPEIDRIVSLCGRPWARVLLSQLGDIDFASRLFKPLHLALGAASPLLLRALGERLQSKDTSPLDDALDGLDLDPAMVRRIAAG